MKSILIWCFLICGPMALIFSCSSSTTSGGGGQQVSQNITISPSAGRVGTVVNVSTTEIDLTNVNSVSIGETPALILSKNPSSMQIFIMPGSTTGQVRVTTSSETATSPDNFVISTTMTMGPTQQGNKLVGTGNTGDSLQGSAVRLSSDGNTAVVSGPDDNVGMGAVWVFTRENGVWSQQGTKLLGTGSVESYGGDSIAISADGNTIAAGGRGDNSGVGTVWIFTRTGGVWSQQGQKLVGTGGILRSRFGHAVDLSADGNTLVVGGDLDNTDNSGDYGVGAVWVFNRTGGVWSQTGSKIVPTGYVGSANIGTAVAISADGKTFVVTGYEDDNKGAAWVFTLSNGSWIQQGSKITPTDWASFFTFGSSASISADGNTIVIGSNSDDNSRGAAFVFTRAGGLWSQQGSKLVGSGSVGLTFQAETVSLCADGNTLALAGFGDSSNQGAAWLFQRTGSVWSQVGSKFRGSGSGGTAMQAAVAVSADCSTLILGGNNDGVGNNVGAAWIFTL